MRHDIHARLTVIVGYADLLRTRDDEQLRREAPGRILEAAELLRQDLDALFGEPPPRPAPLAARRTAGAGPVEIVVIDDDEELRALLRLTLPDGDFSVHEAAGGGAGMQLIEQEAPALVLLDWHMPEKPGAEVLEELRRRWPELPVIVLTAERRSTERRRAEELGAAAFLRKPFSPIELLATIERLLAERRPR